VRGVRGGGEEKNGGALETKVLTRYKTGWGLGQLEAIGSNAQDIKVSILGPLVSDRNLSFGEGGAMGMQKTNKPLPALVIPGGDTWPG